MAATSSPIGSCSYQGQDLFVLEVLGGLRGGFFLDSGASDGISGSNSRLLETAFQWQGICVEPNEDTFRTLRNNRACICLDCCLSDRDGPVEFLEGAGVYGGILEHYEAGHLEFARHMLQMQRPDRTADTVTKQARTLRSLLSACGAPRVIDYWSLDTEGSELILLKSFPFDQYTFRVLTVEHNETPVREEIRQFLESRGYTRIRALGIDDGYILNGIPPGQDRRSAVWRRGRL